MIFTKHAIKRLVERNPLQSDDMYGLHLTYAMKDVIDTINTGVKLKHRADPDNKCTFVNNTTGMMVVTNIDTTVVITVWWKGQ